MKNNQVPMFKIAWALMPLPKEELELISHYHRHRPYLLCMEKDSFYYAFPCTSNLFHNNIRYENQKIELKTILSESKSLVDIGKVYKLPKENLRSYIEFISPIYNNEILKKLNACSEYSDYPEEFMDYFRQFNYSLEKDDLIELEEELYVITDLKPRNYSASKVYSYPLNNSYPVITDGLRYFVSPESYIIDKKDLYKYRSHIKDFSEKEKEPISIEEKDYSKLYNLEPGMIITYKTGENTNKMVILDNCITRLFGIYGEEKQMYRDYKPITIRVDTEIDYKVTGYLTEERTKKLIEKTNEAIFNEHNQSKKITKTRRK